MPPEVRCRGALVGCPLRSRRFLSRRILRNLLLGTWTNSLLNLLPSDSNPRVTSSLGVTTNCWPGPRVPSRHCPSAFTPRAAAPLPLAICARKQLSGRAKQEQQFCCAIASFARCWRPALLNRAARNKVRASSRATRARESPGLEGCCAHDMHEKVNSAQFK